jgi:molybdate transport system substrate-binding protein
MSRLPLVLALALVGCRSSEPEPLRVAAASDLTEAFTELGARFEEDTGTKVVFSFGSSGLLARQLAEGAPFDLFAAANRGFAEDAARSGACDAATLRAYARGKLAAWSLSEPLPSLETLREARFRRIALANPEHAPYGRAAKEALLEAGLWEAVSPRVVYAENVRQALQLARTGNAEAAFVSAANLAGAREGTTLLVADTPTAPLEQALVRCTHGKQPAAAVRFLSFLDTPAAKALMQRYGFTPP